MPLYSVVLRSDTHFIEKKWWFQSTFVSQNREKRNWCSFLPSFQMFTLYIICVQLAYFFCLLYAGGAHKLALTLGRLKLRLIVKAPKAKVGCHHSDSVPFYFFSLSFSLFHLNCLYDHLTFHPPASFLVVYPHKHTFSKQTFFTLLLSVDYLLCCSLFSAWCHTVHFKS